MQLLVIRHAIAQSREQSAEAGLDDALRPITEEGRRRMRRTARGLRQIVDRIDLLATSPLLRAVQTAAIVAAEFDLADATPVPALEPDRSPAVFLTWLRQHEDRDLVAIVGHEPHLGTLVTWLLTGVDQPRVPLKKGGACLLDFPRRIAKGEAVLQWALTPSLLRRIADRRGDA